jgi:hypothetical protein
MPAAATAVAADVGSGTFVSRSLALNWPGAKVKSRTSSIHLSKNSLGVPPAVA